RLCGQSCNVVRRLYSSCVARQSRIQVSRGHNSLVSTRARAALQNRRKLDASLRLLAGLRGILLFSIPGGKRDLRCLSPELLCTVTTSTSYNSRNALVCDIIKELTVSSRS